MECLRKLDDISQRGNCQPSMKSASLDEHVGASSVTRDNVWDDFETCAQSVAALYRLPNWHSFQHAAATTTQFYKASSESQRRAYEQGVAAGRQRLIKELLCTLMSGPQSVIHQGRVFVRRDELLAVLAAGGSGSGGGVVQRTQRDGTHRPHRQYARSRTPDTNDLPTNSTDAAAPGGLRLFTEALVPQVLTGSPSRSTPAAVELGTFLIDQVRRHRKRGRATIAADIDSSPSGGRSPMDVAGSGSPPVSKRARAE